MAAEPHSFNPTEIIRSLRTVQNFGDTSAVQCHVGSTPGKIPSVSLRHPDHALSLAQRLDECYQLLSMKDSALMQGESKHDFSGSPSQDFCHYQKMVERSLYRTNQELDQMHVSYQRLNSLLVESEQLREQEKNEYLSLEKHYKDEIKKMKQTIRRLLASKEKEAQQQRDDNGLKPPVLSMGNGNEASSLVLNGQSSFFASNSARGGATPPRPGGGGGGGGGGNTAAGGAPSRSPPPPVGSGTSRVGNQATPRRRSTSSTLGGVASSRRTGLSGVVAAAGTCGPPAAAISPAKKGGAGGSGGQGGASPVVFRVNLAADEGRVIKRSNVLYSNTT